MRKLNNYLCKNDCAMDLTARKYHFIEELLKVDNESIMAKLEKVLMKEKGIPAAHKKILDERMDEYKKNPEDVLNWDDVKNDW